MASPGIHDSISSVQLDRRGDVTKPDTRPLVTYGWAGAVILKNWRKRYFYESVTDGGTNGRMDQRTDTPSDRVACTRLKTARKVNVLPTNGPTNQLTD